MGRRTPWIVLGTPILQMCSIICPFS
jgi:hypothetical protein